MREIKFRAWYAGTKVMTEGFTLDHLLKTAHKHDERSFSEAQSYSDVMQYTGLKDKNGVEIFEGDIVKGVSDKYDGKDFDFVGKVHFHDDLGMFDIYGYCEQPLRFFKSLEIIGNIYETSELLK